MIDDYNKFKLNEALVPAKFYFDLIKVGDEIIHYKIGKLVVKDIDLYKRRITLQNLEGKIKSFDITLAPPEIFSIEDFVVKSRFERLNDDIRESESQMKKLDVIFREKNEKLKTLSQELRELNDERQKVRGEFERLREIKKNFKTDDMRKADPFDEEIWY